MSPINTQSGLGISIKKLIKVIKKLIKVKLTVKRQSNWFTTSTLLNDLHIKRTDIKYSELTFTNLLNIKYNLRVWTALMCFCAITESIWICSATSCCMAATRTSTISTWVWTTAFNWLWFNWLWFALVISSWVEPCFNQQPIVKVFNGSNGFAVWCKTS